MNSKENVPNYKILRRELKSLDFLIKLYHSLCNLLDLYKFIIV